MSGATDRLKARWDGFWFEPVGPANLGFLRVVFYGGILWLYGVWWHVDYSAWGDVSDAFWMPIHLFRVLGLSAASPDVLGMLQGTWLIAVALACIGLWTRPATWVALLTGAYLLALPHNFGKIHHADAIVAITLGTMAFARCGDAWSVDRLLDRWRHPRGAEIPASGEYSWPVKLAWTLVTLLFLGAGVSKLRHSGLAWIFSDNMQILLLRHRAPLGEFVAQWGWIPVTMAFITVLFEVAAPLALFSRRARAVLIPGLFSMQIGIALLMHVTFTQFILLYLFWVPWVAVGRWLARRLGSEPRRIMLFDGDCGLCERTVAVVRGLDLLGRVEPRDLSRDWAAVRALFPDLDRAACLEAMHVVGPGGRISVGFDAYRSLARALPLGWILLPLLHLPGARTVGRAVYRYVSARGRGHGCALPRAHA